MSKRLLMLSLLAGLSASSTGCFPRVRQCIANRWHANHPNGLFGGACCTPAFKVPAQAGYPVGAPMGGPAGCSSCGIEGGGMGAPIIYQAQPQYQYPAGTPNIGAPMPLLGNGAVPGTMPPKN